MTDHKDIVNNFRHRAVQVYSLHSDNLPEGTISHSEKFRLGQLFTRELQTEATAAIDEGCANPGIDETQLQKDIYAICHELFNKWNQEYSSE